MEETAKQLAERRLRSMVDAACTVIENSLVRTKVDRGQQTRSADAWGVINSVLKLNEQAQPKPAPEDDQPLDELSERLRRIKQQERRGK